MRTSILMWSTISGVVVGLLGGALLAALGTIVGALLPGVQARVGPRWIAAALTLCFVVLPAIGGVLGFLEGRLKLR